MASSGYAQGDGQNIPPAYERIARRIGLRLRELYGSPETEPLPVEHVELLLRLRHKERDQARSTEAV